MDIGGTKIMNGPRPVLQEAGIQSPENLSDTSVITDGKVPPDNSSTVSLEITSNPLSYWPPPSSTLPSVNFSKNENDIRSQITRNDGSKIGDPAKNSSVVPSSDREDLQMKELSEKTPYSCSDSSSVQTIKTLHHNLPPIAGITSSHNYRGVRENQKHAQLSSNDLVIKTKHQESASEDAAAKNDFKKDEDDKKSVSDKAEDNLNSVKSNECSNLEVPISTPVEVSKISNADYVFSVPATVNSGVYPKITASTRAPTPFINFNESSGEPVSKSVGVSSASLANSPSSFSKSRFSSEFVVPSTTDSISSSNSTFVPPVVASRMLTSPHSNLSSPHPTSPSPRLKMSSCVEVSRTSPFLASSSETYQTQRSGHISPFHSSSQQNYHHVNSPKNSSGGSSYQTIPSDSNSLRVVTKSSDSEKTFKDPSSKSQNNQYSMQALRIPPTNSSEMSSLQRIDQTQDSQSCKNPFELPTSKSHPQFYSHKQQQYQQAIQHQQYQQQHTHHRVHHPLSQQQQNHHPHLQQSQNYHLESQQQQNHHLQSRQQQNHHLQSRQQQNHHLQSQEQQLQNHRIQSHTEQNQRAQALQQQNQHRQSQQEQQQQHSQYRHQQQDQRLQQNLHFGAFPNNLKTSHDHVRKTNNFPNPSPKEYYRHSENNFYQASLKQTALKVNDKETGRSNEGHAKHSLNLPTTLNSKEFNSKDLTQIDVSRQRGDGIIFQKKSEELGIKSNSTGAGLDNSWTISQSASSAKQNFNKILSKVNGDECGDRKVSELSYLNATKQGQTMRENVRGVVGLEDKRSDSFNSLNNASTLKFPPVPQSNYDLNRHIYDSMTRGNRPHHPQAINKNIEKSMHNQKEQSDVLPAKSQPFYREFTEQDKLKGFGKQVEYASQDKLAGRSVQEVYLHNYVKQHTPTIGQASYQNKKLHENQLVANHGFQHQQQIQRNESKFPQSSSFGDHLQSGKNILQTPHQMLVSEKIRPVSEVQNSVYFQKYIPDVGEFNPKKQSERTSKGNSVQLRSVQEMRPSVENNELNERSLQSSSFRSKRESPLDLSVKTVRQSADSTAKDDGDPFSQSLRNPLHGNQTSHSENRFPVSQFNNESTGAPKIDFTPNFSGFHSESSRPTTPLHHKSEVSVLPPVDSFKNIPGRAVTPTVQEIKVNSDSPSKYLSQSVTMTCQKSQTNTISQSFKYSLTDHAETGAQKRSLNDYIRNHSSEPKIPKIDSWKVAFDQHIEQRLHSARIHHQNAQNKERAANGTEPTKFLGTPLLTSPNFQGSRLSNNNYRSPNVYPQPPFQSSAAPYNPSYVQQPQCQSATPQTPKEKLEQRESVGHSPDPEQIIKQISKGVMPDHKLLQDKNVLSILRSSLEEKEAKLMQLREAAKKKEKYKELMTLETKKQCHSSVQSKSSLPPFGALPLERMCAPPSFPGHKLNIPRSIDTVKIDIEPTHKYFRSEALNNEAKGGIPNIEPTFYDGGQGPPADLDGLAAFLAARIRTKGELKQVGPTLESIRTITNHSPKGASAYVPVTSANTTETFANGNFLNVVSQATNHPTSGSPPKLVRESRLLPPTRRRLLSHVEDEIPSTSGLTNENTTLPPRDPNGIRSSSETSVFDFRDSDSESEMPVLERQTLEGMRRDRKNFGSKQNVSIITSEQGMDFEKPEVIAELDKSHPDPFWDTAFDMFVEQLEKRPPKRSVRKKKTCSRIPFSGSETDECDRVKVYEDFEKSNISSGTVDDEKEKNVPEEVDKSIRIEVKKEPEEDKPEIIVEGHVKLSSSRLKNYRDDMMKEERKANQDKVKVESENEDSRKDIDNKKSQVNTSQRKKEQEKIKKAVGVKTRGKSKVSEKKTEKETISYESETEERRLPSDSESTIEDDDDSLSLSSLESESSDSDATQPSSNSSYSSNDSENEVSPKKKTRMQTRLQTRSSSMRQTKKIGMNLRSRKTSVPKQTSKPSKKKKRKKLEYCSGKKKKTYFGDGSHFRPGWEEECYKFKQQLRMPEKLISISRPPKRSTVSLPDLDPYRNSPSLDSSDVTMNKKIDIGKGSPESEDESGNDADLGRQKLKNQKEFSNNASSLLKSRNGKKTQSNSILNMLVDKYGKGSAKKQKELKAINERKSPRILPKATNKPELLPTPSLGIGKENVLKDKKRSKDGNKKKQDEGDSVYLGYFRKKTVNNFKEAFQQKVGVLPQEFSPVILKSRTRTQTRDLKKRATLMEVFGEERPASAPPLSREEDDSGEQEKVQKISEKKKGKVLKKVCVGMVTRGRGKLMRSGRPGLRSTAVLRSNKAVQISKRHLNSGHKRSRELLRMRAMASKKFSYLVNSSENTNQLPITKKRLKLRSVRRKFRSGFDYIRKKKKLKKDGDSADGSVKEKKIVSRPTSESVEDIQNEIRNWVINKGLGETVLHRAARLGYTDIAAYCLEKMNCSPSPRDNAGYTPLHEACSRGHLEIAKLLLMYGASVSESAKGGIRPLHEAAENGFTELVRLLLSYGADPLLETYTGHTALSLVSDEETRRLIQHHLADVQGNVAPSWTFYGPASLFDPPDSGYDPISDIPSHEPSIQIEYELEVSEASLPPLYRLSSDRDPDRRWVLMKDLFLCTKAKSKEVLIRQVGASSIREMKLSEFQEQGKCCNFLGLEKPLSKAPKVVLVSYDEKVRQLLGVERVSV